MPQAEVTLEPCPFCGGPGYLWEDERTGLWVDCHNPCEFSLPLSRWNTRTPAPAQPQPDDLGPRLAGWPDDGSPLDFQDITRPVVDAMRYVYRLSRKAVSDVPWTGPDIGIEECATCLSPAEQLTADNLAYSECEQGRSPLEEIIGLAVRLGIEQGRRIARSREGAPQ